MTNCGMSVAMDIGVIRDHVSRVLSVFLSRRLRCLGGDLFRKARSTSVLHAAMKEDQEVG
jgi:hypothetical protein